MKTEEDIELWYEEASENATEAFRKELEEGKSHSEAEAKFHKKMKKIIGQYENYHLKLIKHQGFLNKVNDKKKRISELINNKKERLKEKLHIRDKGKKEEFA